MAAHRHLPVAFLSLIGAGCHVLPRPGRPQHPSGAKVRTLLPGAGPCYPPGQPWQWAQAAMGRGPRQEGQLHEAPIAKVARAIVPPWLFSLLLPFPIPLLGLQLASASPHQSGQLQLSRPGAEKHGPRRNHPHFSFRKRPKPANSPSRKPLLIAQRGAPA